MLLVRLLAVCSVPLAQAFQQQQRRRCATSFLRSGDKTLGQDLRRWEEMYKQGGESAEDVAGRDTVSPVRVVTFDLDNTLWNTTASISAANDALAAHMNEKLPGNAVRVETVMGSLYSANKERYCPIEKKDAKSPVLLTQLRKDAIRHVLSIDDEQQELQQQHIDKAFDVWTNARHDAIPNHLADSVISCLQEISSSNVVIGAITDGNSDPLKIPGLSKYFDFCINAEMVGISKPDKRVYLRAVAEAIMHPSLQDLQPETLKGDGLTDDVLENLCGPWWVHIGDDFVKDIVAAKSLKMRSIWSRELVLEKSVGEEMRKAAPRNERTVEDLVQDVESMKVVEMQVGATDYLADSLQKEFADAITDEFRGVANILSQWQKEAVSDERSKEEAVAGEERWLEVIRPDNAPLAGSIANDSKAADTKYCTACGAKHPSVANFCSSCGKKQ